MYSLGLTIFGKFADENFVVCFSVVKELKSFICEIFKHFHIQRMVFYIIKEVYFIFKATRSYIHVSVRLLCMHTFFINI